MTENFKQLIKKEFQNAFEAVYEDRIDVELDSSLKKGGEYARIRTYGGASRVKLYVNWDKWQEKTKERQMSMIIHELTHIDHSGHKIEFWDTFASNYFDCRDKGRFERNYDWRGVARSIVEDAHANNVDRRQTTVGEMRGRLEEKLGVQLDDGISRDKYQAKFDDLRDIRKDTVNEKQSLEIEEELVFEHDFTKEEIWKFFKENREKIYGGRSWGQYRFPVPKVKESDYQGEGRKHHFRTKKDEKIAMVWLALDRTWIDVEYRENN